MSVELDLTLSLTFNFYKSLIFSFSDSSLWFWEVEFITIIN